MRVAVDVGFGHTKVMSDNGVKVTFPSVVAKEDYGRAADDIVFEGKVRQKVTINEEGWLFGSSAITSPTAIRPWDSVAAKRTGYDVLVIASILSCMEGWMAAVDVDLVLGLPVSMYGAQRDDLRRRFEGLALEARLGDLPATSIRISSVLVLPQSAGVYYASVLDSSGAVCDETLMDGTVGVIDAGFRTTDLFVMTRDDDGIHPVKSLSTSIDQGVSQVYERVRRRIESMVGGMVDPLDIEKALRTTSGVLVHTGIRVELRPLIVEEATPVANSIADSVRVVWGRSLSTMAAILLAGGGAVVLGHVLRDISPVARVVPDPQYANVRGFLAAQARRARSQARF